MKKIIMSLVLIICLFAFTVNIKAEKEITVHLFYSQTCPHCKNEKEFLGKLIKKKSNLKIELYEINEEENLILYNKLRQLFDIEKPSIPLTIIGTVHYIGYNGDIGSSIKNAINYYEKNQYSDLIKEIKENKFEVGKDTLKIDVIKKEQFTIPLLGEVDPLNISLPIVAALIGAVDGFNPCAMWVLLFLISMLIGMKNRAKMWIIGLTFLLTSALMYMFIMFTWLQISISLMAANWVKMGIGLFALAFGLFNLYKFYQASKKDVGCSVAPKEKRNKIFDKIKKFTTEKNIFVAIIGVVTLAISVNLIELACSAGLPLVFTQILALNDLSNLKYVLYIVIYILFFLLDDIIIFLIAMITLEKVGITNKYSKYSNLIGGIIMVIIGVLMIFNPGLLSFN